MASYNLGRIDNNHWSNLPHTLDAMPLRYNRRVDLVGYNPQLLQLVYHRMIDDDAQDRATDERPSFRQVQWHVSQYRHAPLRQ